MNKYNKLFKNSIIFAIGNFGSKIINLILVPFYTFYLTTNQYGKVDLLSTMVTLFVPIISISISEAVLRFVMSKEEDTKMILTNSILVFFTVFIGLALFYPLLKYFNYFSGLESFFVAILLLQILQTIFSQFIRGIGKVRIYALNGLIFTLTLGISNVYLLSFLKIGLDGYFYSLIIANFISVLFLFFIGKIYIFIDFSSFNVPIIRKMLRYSIPLIPNSIMWWLVDGANKFLVLFFLGVSSNGLFAVASKIPTILSTLSSIFNQAWQLSAIEEYDSNNKTKFYSAIFMLYSQALFIVSSFILIILKPLYVYAISDNFFESWKLVPFLLLSVIYSSYSVFLGTNYIAAKNTKGVMGTTLVGALTNIILNCIFIPYFGVISVGISSSIGFFLVFLMRLKQTEKYVKINISLKTMFTDHLFFFVELTLLFFLKGTRLIIFQVIIYSLYIFLKQRIIKKGLMFIFSKKNHI